VLLWTVDDPMTESLELKNLITGKPYYIRVASISDAGESSLVDSEPKLITPGGVPDPIALPHIRS
jgi:hypothetical protein